MGKPHPMELCSRVVDYMDEGHGHRQVARLFRVSSKFVNDRVKLRRETGYLTPRRQGNGDEHGKLVDVTGWLEARVTAKSGITLDELVAELAETHGIDVHRTTVWRVLRGLGLNHKKTLQALEQKRKDVAALRHVWIARRQPFMANHLDWLSLMVRRKRH